MKALTEDAQQDRIDFESEYGRDGNCSCHISPPCPSCVHPGNPLNQEDENSWRKKMATEYRGYFIEYDPPPIGTRAHDWAFMADGFDGAQDSGDDRCGTGPTVEDCIRQIDELEDEYDD